MEATANMTTDEWLTCKADSDYEILKAYPHTIRRKSNGRIVAETPLPGGYLKMNLNGETTYKHRVVALQFIPNDDPVNKTQVDHINWQRDDNRIENLRWVTALQNNLNRSSSKGVEYGGFLILPYGGLNFSHSSLWEILFLETSRRYRRSEMVYI